MWEHIGEPRKVDRLTASRQDVTETPHSHSGPDRGRRVTWAGGLLVIVAPASRLRPHHKVGREGGGHPTPLGASLVFQESR